MNPFLTQGLVPGVALNLEVLTARGLKTLTTRVDDVTDVLSVLVPIQRLHARPLPTGIFVRATYVALDHRWRFVTEVVGHSPDATLDYLALPAVVESSDRRSAFRLETALEPDQIYRIVVDVDGMMEHEQDLAATTVVDMSEGGVCLSSRDRANPGETIGMALNLPLIGHIVARMKVTSVEPPLVGHINHHLHCQFSEIGRGDRDKIARFLMRRQIEMRRRGLL